MPATGSSIFVDARASSYLAVPKDRAITAKPALKTKCIRHSEAIGTSCGGTVTATSCTKPSVQSQR